MQISRISKNILLQFKSSFFFFFFWPPTNLKKFLGRMLNSNPSWCPRLCGHTGSLIHCTWQGWGLNLHCSRQRQHWPRNLLHHSRNSSNSFKWYIGLVNSLEHITKGFFPPLNLNKKKTNTSLCKLNDFKTIDSQRKTLKTRADS